jgi:deoxyribonuclease V
MIISVDVHYDESADMAQAACVVFEQWTDSVPSWVKTRPHRGIEPYEPGAFYKRELPCILPLIRECRRQTHIDTVVVDGFVDLDAGRPGLGRHLYTALEEDIAVIGVAKSAFDGAPARPVARGDSNRPLWVTSTSDVHEAVRHIISMAGPHRIPTLIKLVDSLARGRSIS